MRVIPIQIDRVTRHARLSANGNPLHTVRALDGREWRTESDGSVNYGINNSDLRDRTIQLHVESGRIVAAFDESNRERLA
jgi:hypothetical protein